jgi:DNA-binding MarR family transcriptional regulator
MTHASQFDQLLLEWIELFRRRSMQDFSRWMALCGLSKSQIGTMMRLYYHGQCPVSGIGDELGITPAAASQLVDRLVQQGFLERSEDPDDRRIKQVSLSTAGRTLIQQGVEARLGWMRELAEFLTPEEQVIAIQALELLIQAAREREEAIQATFPA